MALLNRGQIWSESNFAKKNLIILKSDRGQLVDHDHDVPTTITNFDQS